MSELCKTTAEIAEKVMEGAFKKELTVTQAEYMIQITLIELSNIIDHLESQSPKKVTEFVMKKLRRGTVNGHNGGTSDGSSWSRNKRMERLAALKTINQQAIDETNKELADTDL